jgi:hypothetical protein
VAQQQFCLSQNCCCTASSCRVFRCVVTNSRQFSISILLQFTFSFIYSWATRRFALRPAVSAPASWHDAVRTPILTRWRRLLAHGNQFRSCIFDFDSGHRFPISFLCLRSQLAFSRRHGAPCASRAPPTTGHHDVKNFANFFSSFHLTTSVFRSYFVVQFRKNMRCGDKLRRCCCERADLQRHAHVDVALSV